MQPVRACFCQLFLIALLLLCGGCSFATKLAYNNADWLVYREIDDYLILNSVQKDRYEETFDALWSWHRAEELPRYAARLRELAALAQNPDVEFSAADLAHESEQISWLLDRSTTRLIAGFTPVLAQLDDAQVAHLLAKLDEKNQEFQRKWVEPGADRIRKKRIKLLRKRLKRWLGKLDETQEAEIVRFTDARQANQQGWNDFRTRWREELESALLARTAPDFGSRIEKLVMAPDHLYSDGLQQSVNLNAALWLDALTRILNQASDKQRTKASKRLLDYAEDFEELFNDARAANRDSPEQFTTARA